MKKNWQIPEIQDLAVKSTEYSKKKSDNVDGWWTDAKTHEVTDYFS